MSQTSKIIGESKVGHKNRITLVGELVRILKVKEGDTIVYILDERGNIILKNSKDVKISIQY